MADIPESTKRDAIDILTTYVDFIRNEVRANDFERHPYVPHIEQTIEDLRAAPPAMDREAVEKLVQPWADYHGDLPDYDHPLRPVYESGIQYAVELLAKELGVTDWTPCDGTEEFDGDLGGTMTNIVLEAMPKDKDGDPIHPRDLLSTLSADAIRQGEGEIFTGVEAWDELVNVDDRTSPEEYPDMCLITRNELIDFMSRATPASHASDGGEGMRYYVDCEFDGHNGPLLSIAIVREDGESLHIETTEPARDPWVVENVMPHMGKHMAGVSLQVPATMVGRKLVAFIGTDEAPTIVADSPVDIARFCTAISTAAGGGYAPFAFPRMSFEVRDVDCYPTALVGAVQHNAWWDAMALRHKLQGDPA